MPSSAASMPRIPTTISCPSPGVIKHITVPLGLGVRYDGYVYEGYEIPMYYDPLISKLISWGKTREESIARMRRALYEYKITGVKNSTSSSWNGSWRPLISSKENTTPILSRRMRASCSGTSLAAPNAKTWPSSPASSTISTNWKDPAARLYR